MLRLCTISIALLLPGVGLAQQKAAGLGDPGKLLSLSIETGRGKGGFPLRGRDAGQQLLVTGHYTAGQTRDLTQKATYSATADVVRIDKAGYVAALKEGDAVIQVEVDGIRATTKVHVSDIETDLPVHFANEVVPILTRYGCNAGGCHGKTGGQAGFQLSLLGFEPTEDYDFLKRESKGRRVLLASPEYSLLLRKATGEMPHGGGRKLPKESAAYRVMKRWVEQGMPFGRDDDATVTRIEVLPSERTMSLSGSQQLAVVAHFTNGSTRDVTRLAQFETNNSDLARVSETGLVTIKDIPGSVAVMVRFQISVGVFRATVPLGVVKLDLPAPANFIDEHVFANLKKLGLPASELCDDATFLRRATIDIAGRLPTVDETTAFLKDTTPDRREKLVDRLLASGDYADYFANKWNAVLRNKRASPKADLKPHIAFHAWIRDNLEKNLPFDQFARAILTAQGEEADNPPVTWYREVNDAFAQVEDTAQLFLGTRIGCARCHHHPLEKWSQTDYYGLAAFFARVDYKKPPKVVVKKGEKKPKAGPPIVHVILKEGKATLKHPRTNTPVSPTVLDGKPETMPSDMDPRTVLADWVTSGDNPYFARTLVNRYWKHFLGRGLTEPEDDLRITNPPSNPALLDALAKHFVDTGFDLKKLVRAICLSKTYQFSAKANEHNKDDRQNFSHFLPRRLAAEVLHDAIDTVTLYKPQFQGMPAGTRAVQLPDSAFDSYFLTVFGRPDATSACECERSSDLSLSQMLHLMNSYEVLAKVGTSITPKISLEKVAKGKKAPTPKKLAPGDRAALLAKDKRPHDARIRELFLATYSREPRPRELKLLVAHVEANAGDIRAAYEDILWALINSEEFLFNR